MFELDFDCLRFKFYVVGVGVTVGAPLVVGEGVAFNVGCGESITGKTWRSSSQAPSRLSALETGLSGRLAIADSR